MFRLSTCTVGMAGLKRRFRLRYFTYKLDMKVWHLAFFASEGVLLSESSVVTCESRPLYLALPAWGSVTVSLRRGVGCASSWRSENYVTYLHPPG